MSQGNQATRLRVWKEMTYHEAESRHEWRRGDRGPVFELVSPLARESMGEVHRGRDLQTGDTAVKLPWRTADESPLVA